MGRAPCCEKVGLKRGRWTAEEDEILTQYVLANGEGSWRSLPKNAGLLRCGKSCRLRWINYLRADLKRGNITRAEEETIVKLHTAFGNRWSLIAAHLPGRTDNEIKNYWNSHLSRKIYSFSKNNAFLTTAAATTTTNINIANIDGSCKYKGSRVSRSAMKKQKTNTLMLIGKNRSIETKEKEAMIINKSKENLSLSLETQENLTVNEGKQIIGWGPRNELEDSTMASDINVQGSGEKLNAPEGWGPYEWLDSEINRLKYFLEADHQAVDPSGNHHTSNKEEEEEEEESGDLYNNCGSPVNLGFDEEWYNVSFDWNSTIRDINVNDDRKNDLWDEGDKILSGLWS